MVSGSVVWARKRPLGLAVTGGILWVAVQALHFSDVLGWSNAVTTFVRSNITPMAWLAYIVMVAGILGTMDGVSYVRRYRNRLLVLWLWSVPCWCYFDWMNFYFMRDPHTGLRAWEYINLPRDFGDRLVGYVIAFGAIAPGMFLTAEVLQRLGFRQANAKSKTQNTKRSGIAVAVFVLGLLLAPVPILVGTPASNLAIWVGTWALLDPINLWCGRPSIVGDWHAGRFGRTLALGAGGLICGFLWEFWNYWSYTKWIYHLPFLGGWERYKYFEMPLPGLVGFIAFGIETWTIWQTSLIVLGPLVEGEANGVGDGWLRDEGCV